jgi:hypothetical protein
MASAKPGAPNAYGLVVGAANAPGPRKRPLSLMACQAVRGSGHGSRCRGSAQSTFRENGMLMGAADPRQRAPWPPDIEARGKPGAVVMLRWARPVPRHNAPLDPSKCVNPVGVCVETIVSQASEPLPDEVRPAGFAAKKRRHACERRHCVANRAHEKVLASAQERTHNHPDNSARICAPDK